jgi:transmembrane sensor
VSNIVEFRDPAAINAEARAWLVRLDGDMPLDDSEQRALREWMHISPANRAELQRLAAFWKDANVLTQLAVPLQRRRRLDFLRWLTEPKLGRRALLGLMLVTVAVVFVVWSWFPRSAPNGIYATTIGQQKTLMLADGSSVQINTDTQLQVDYGERIRKIWLLRGEAYFSVAPNRRKPFEVFAAGGVVRAVGTAFSVHLHGSETDVTVTKGQVDVLPDEPASSESADHIAPPNARALISLKAGQASTFSRARIGSAVVAAATEQLTETELNRRTAWHDGYLVFSGQRLDAVISEVNRYSSVSLQLADPRLAQISVGGRFKVGDLDAVCDVLQSSFGIQVDRVDDRHIQLRAAPVR